MTAQHFPLGAALFSISGYSPDHPEMPIISTMTLRLMFASVVRFSLRAR
jgi:hypothetical protein